MGAGVPVLDQERLVVMKRLIIAFIVTTIAASLLPAKHVSALGEMPNIIPTGKFKLDQEVSQISSLVGEKEKEVKEVATSLKSAEEAKKSLEDQVNQAKAEVEELDSLFVHINRYAPDAHLGNRYVGGNCTWYVKSVRPDIGNFWGNANTWYSNAKAQGWNVGDTPKKGAVATTTKGYYGHVAYVIGISKDRQTVTVSEMNYKGLGVVSTRTAHYTEFKYIYELD